MPELESKDIQALVWGGEIVALTLDTNIFDQFQCNLDNKSLAALGQFKGTKIKVLLSPIILGEVRAHIAKKISDAAEKARAAINQYFRAMRDDRDRVEVARQIGLNTDPEYAERQVAAFASAIGAIEVPIEPDVSVAEVMRRYFAAEPPFSANNTKKSEFPDAIALLSLESWAEAQGGYVLAVSKDGDWSSYAEQSARIICVKDLAAGLNFFHTESSVVAARLAARIRGGTVPSLKRAIEYRLERYIEEFEIEANSDYMFDQDPEHSQVINWSLAESSPVDVLASDEDSVTISFEIEVEAEFGARFSFSIRDPIDRDDVTIGSTSAYRNETLNVQVVATVPKENDEDPDPFDVEVEGRSLLIDFDYVGPEHDEEY
jgi:hypothetical protein